MKKTPNRSAPDGSLSRMKSRRARGDQRISPVMGLEHEAIMIPMREMSAKKVGMAKI